MSVKRENYGSNGAHLHMTTVDAFVVFVDMVPTLYEHFTNRLDFDHP